MPISYEFDGDAGFVRIEARGDITLEEEREALAAILADSDHRPGLAMLIDFRERGEPASAEHVRGLAHAFEEHRADVGGARLALVVSREVSVGLGRMFEALTTDLAIEMRIFREIEKAEKWLRSGGKSDE